VLFAAGIAAVAAFYLRTKVSHTLVFWAAFVLTSRLGVTLGDLMDKPAASGGLNLSRYSASLPPSRRDTRMHAAAGAEACRLSRKPATSLSAACERRRREPTSRVTCRGSAF
jgi:hypothetical protein